MNLENFFDENNKVAIAFSGGVDSAYLLYMAKKCGADVRAYYAKSAFQPQFEYEDAVRFAKEQDVRLKIVYPDVLASTCIINNTEKRCYYCKRMMLEAISMRARRDGYTVLLDGTNASDVVADRPGMQALKEWRVRSPLRECGLTKDAIRRLSHEAGLFTWDKPAYACLATRIRTGEMITRDKLEATEQAEAYLANLGFRNFRVRRVGDIALLQFTPSDTKRFLEQKDVIVTVLGRYYQEVIMDEKVQRDE
ncbi:MAG: ATP-dependent sacrificial sulfur transferase LarE [Eubacteriales bacterium]|nr:ATP-dependent sacrificial sulfur transferase LarE [Eubacteriales bacterium]